MGGWVEARYSGHTTVAGGGRNAVDFRGTWCSVGGMTDDVPRPTPNPTPGPAELGSPELPVALSVAGSDSGGGAGIQADLLTFAALGVFGTTAITCLTAQNPCGVRAVHPVDRSMVRSQMEAVEEGFRVRAVKTGMLFQAGIIAEVEDFRKAHPTTPWVVDPVMVATSGALLLCPDAIEALRSLMRRATLITPNLDEAAVLVGRRPTDLGQMEAVAARLVESFGCGVLLKGGHLPGPDLADLLMLPDGSTRCFRHRRREKVNTHGSGCTLAAAVAARLAWGDSVEAAVEGALSYLQATLSHPLGVAGDRFLAHFPPGDAVSRAHSSGPAGA